MAKQLFGNNIESSIAAPGISDTDLVIPLPTGHGVRFGNPTGGDYGIATISAVGLVENVKYDQVSGDTLIIPSVAERGFEGTGAKTWSQGAKVELNVSKNALENFVQVSDLDLDIFPKLSGLVDFFVVADDVFVYTAPAGYHFYLNEAGFLIEDSSFVTTQPEVSVGITGDTVALLAQTVTTVNLVYDRERFNTFITNAGQTSITASIKVAADGDWMEGRFYFDGYLVKDFY